MEQALPTTANETPARDETVGFDLRTEIRDSKTGKVIRSQPYIRHVHRDKGVVYERAGQFFYENGEPAPGWVQVQTKPKTETPKVETK